MEICVKMYFIPNNFFSLQVLNNDFIAHSVGK